jgi:hypothetical protein
VERKWRTLKSKIQIYMDALGHGSPPFDFPTVLSDMTDGLNNTSSRVIGGVTPKELIDDTPGAVEQMRRKTKPHLFWSATDRKAFFRKVNQHIIADVGQYVRITTAGSTFEKMSQRKHSKLELFTVTRVRFPIPEDGTHYSMYQLEDSDKEPIAGLFRTSEIIPVPSRLSPSNPSFRYHIIQWKNEPKSSGGGSGSGRGIGNRMVWVQYAGQY